MRNLPELSTQIKKGIIIITVHFQATEIVANVTREFKKNFVNIEWMDVSTKAKAFEKVSSNVCIPESSGSLTCSSNGAGRCDGNEYRISPVCEK